MHRSFVAVMRLVGAGTALLITLSCGDSNPFDPPRACTLIGCDDGLKVDLQPNSGWPAGAYQMTVQADDVRVVCRGSLPLPPCASRAISCEPAGVVTIGESGCALPAASHGFSQIAFESKLRPKRVEVSITRDGASVAQATLAPVFQTLFPNGPDCPPGCDTAQARIDVAFR
jgi:hypothetical protein